MRCSRERLNMSEGDEKSAEIAPQRSFCSNVLNYFREYCDCTSIHGFRYFGERKRTVVEKLWWFVTFSVCLGVCVLMILRMYDKWQRSPVIVSFATRETPIYEIPFAAVTICPESKFDQNKFNYTHFRTQPLLTRKQEKEYEYFSLICDSGRKHFSSLDIDNSTDFFSVLFNAASAFPLSYCFWMGKVQDCKDLFKPLITDDGICYTFNMLSPDELFREEVYVYDRDSTRTNSTCGWNLDAGYRESEGIETYPRRALLAGAKNSLELIFTTPKDSIDYTCKDNGLQGYKVNLHLPQRLPRMSANFFRVPLDESVVAAIQPVMMKTSEDVQRYKAHKRECYFPEERYLRYFRNYTQLNCQMECLTNYTMKRCDCVNFFLPREDRTQICGPSKQVCAGDAEMDIQMAALKQKLSKQETLETSENVTVAEVTTCDCLPMCTDLSYNAETSQTDWDWEKQFQAFGGDVKAMNKTTHHFSHLKLFFKSGRFITSERNELYGPTSFVANFGGLIGLFTGFSILSMAELIYFLSLRIVCNLKIYGTGNWSGRTD